MNAWSYTTTPFIFTEFQEHSEELDEWLDITACGSPQQQNGAP
jgi:hypothetical protein